jgi:hypothetical protein
MQYVEHRRGEHASAPVPADRIQTGSTHSTPLIVSPIGLASVEEAGEVERLAR